MNMIQAQERYIQRVNGCHPGHRNRVTRSAWKEFAQWMNKTGYSQAEKQQAMRDAADMAELERNAED